MATVALTLLGVVAVAAVAFVAGPIVVVRLDGGTVREGLALGRTIAWDFTRRAGVGLLVIPLAIAVLLASAALGLMVFAIVDPVWLIWLVLLVVTIRVVVVAYRHRDTVKEIGLLAGVIVLLLAGFGLLAWNAVMLLTAALQGDFWPRMILLVIFAACLIGVVVRAAVEDAIRRTRRD